MLAAGLSKRMGYPKQDVMLGGMTMLELSMLAFTSSNVDELVVIINKPFSRKIPPGKLSPRFVLNPEPSRGLSSSLSLGIESLSTGCEAVVLGLGDKPLVLPSTINRLITVFKKKGATIVVPTYRGARGNPILFHRRFFPSILQVRGDRGAKGVVGANASDVEEVEVEDEGILLDVDTPDDVAKAEAVLAARA